MKLEIRRQGVEVNDQMQAHIQRRLDFALGRFSSRIGAVEVHLADVNGPKGGEDKRCRLLVRLPRAGVVSVEDRDAELTTVVDRAADRLARVVQRTLERKSIVGFDRRTQALFGRDM